MNGCASRLFISIYIAVVFCNTVQAQTTYRCGCGGVDWEQDGMIDLRDYAAFQNCLPNPNAICEKGLGGFSEFAYCMDGPSLNPLREGGGGAVCGNGIVESGEQCDDGNTTNGDGCNATCRLETSGIANDNCASPTPISDGTLFYSNVGATTDGPNEPIDCSFFGRSDIRSDIWYCYIATCSGEAVISLCGSGYDTKMAIYCGCECPSDRPLACSDDDCGTGTDNTQSRVTVNVISGQSYMVRVGGFFGNREQGEGRLTIRCGQDTCVNGVGDCMTAHGEAEPGCSTAGCCNRVCEVDTFCCDVTWDAFCASQASGFCSATGFPSCNALAGSCNSVRTAPGCNNAECCNAVCETDPFCCITTWDENCVGLSNLICATCGRGQGDCLTVRTAPGCNDISCCGRVCPIDSFCCQTEWDATCVQRAEDLCGR